MFERHPQSTTQNSEDGAQARSESLLTTDDILARVHSRSRIPLKRLLLWIVLLVGLLLIIALCVVMVINENMQVAQHAKDSANDAVQAASDLPAVQTGAKPPTEVSIKLSHTASVFVDGRFVGMRRHQKVGLTPGTHVLLVRFGKHAYSETLQVGKRASCVRCDKKTGCTALRERAAQ